MPTVKELKAIAYELEIPDISSMTKAELTDAISAVNAAKEQELDSEEPGETDSEELEDSEESDEDEDSEESDESETEFGSCGNCTCFRKSPREEDDRKVDNLCTRFGASVTPEMSCVEQVDVIIPH